ncbi:helix-turn-helix domain-containing protein [Alicyclobacillus fructus]|uniref:helix-turn-helix domain-containing protein n=1 Tax=Alicyclobacillus fructus TaxID=2816082 RepID=UPI001A8EA989|nr:helix-turn-helix domain-containing protein [Alicyclobacillus fructus]
MDPVFGILTSFGISIYHETMDIIRVLAANLKQLREQQQSSISELERRSGVGKATISSLESGKGNPTIETLWALAKALNVSFGALISASSSEASSVVRSEEGAKISGTAGYTRLIDRLSCEGSLEIYEMVLVPGEQRIADPHPEGVMEHLLVVQGRLKAGPDKEPVLLETGDYISFRGDLPHVYSAIEHEARAVVWMQYPRSLFHPDSTNTTKVKFGRYARTLIERSWTEIMNGLAMTRLRFSAETSDIESVVRELEEIVNSLQDSEMYRWNIQSFVVPEGERTVSVLSFRKNPFTQPSSTHDGIRGSIHDLEGKTVLEKAEYLIDFGRKTLEPDEFEALHHLCTDSSLVIRTLVSEIFTQHGYPTVPKDIQRVEEDHDACELTKEDRIDVDSYNWFELVHPAYARQCVSLARMIRKHIPCDDGHVLACMDVGSGTGAPLIMLLEMIPNLEILAVEPSSAAFYYLKKNLGQRKNIKCVHADFLDFEIERRVPLITSVGASHHLDTYRFLKKAWDCLDVKGKLCIADEMIAPFCTIEERQRNLILHHTAYMLATMVPIPGAIRDRLWPQEKRLVDEFQRNVPLIVADAYENRLNSAIQRCRDLLKFTEGLKLGTLISNRMVAFYRFQVLELQALVAGLDYEVEQKTFPERFTQLARLAGFELSEHERVYPTIGDRDMDAGTHVFVFTKP